MALPEHQAEPDLAPVPEPSVRKRSGGGPAVRRRTRLARGPLTIGESAPRVEPRLAAAEPYRPDTIADGGEVFGLTIRSASVRGLQKRYVGGPRQDDLCLGVHPPTETLIVAVADGVSAATHSHLAAALAVRQAVAAVARQLDEGAGELDWTEIFEQAAWALVEEHRRGRYDADADAREAAPALATTLVVAALTPEQDQNADHPPEQCPDAIGPAKGQNGRGPEPRTLRLQTAAVGDSPVLVLTQDTFEPVVGETDDADGLVGAGVRALPRHTRPTCAKPRSLRRGSVLLVCTDGLALPLANGIGEVGRTLARELADPPDIVDFARLLDFSRSTYDDDRTLVAVWPGSRS